MQLPSQNKPAPENKEGGESLLAEPTNADSEAHLTGDDVKVRVCIVYFLGTCVFRYVKNDL